MPSHDDRAPGHRDTSTEPAGAPDLLDQPEFLQTLIRTAAEGICVWTDQPDTPDMTVSVWNDRMRELTDYALDEVNRLGCYQSLFPDPAVRQAWIARMRCLRGGDDLRQEEWTLARKDGSKRTVAVSTNSIGAGSQRTVVALMSDVTERKRAEEALRLSEARLAMSQRLARLGNWEWDIRTGAVWWSEELYRLFGQDPSTFRPSLQAFLSLVHPDDVPMIREHIERTLQDGAPYLYEARMVHPDGSIRWKRAEGVLERDATGQPIRLWGTAQDITDQRQAAAARRALEDQLREARRLESIGVLAGGIAHEFNNLLTAIIGHAELMEADLPATSSAQAHLGPIRQAADRAADLCRKILAYAGKGRLVIGKVDLQDVVRGAIDLGAAGSVVVFERSATPYVIEGDEEHIRQLVGNLVANAVESGGAVRVAIRNERLNEHAVGRLQLTPGLPAGEYLVLEVTDTGPGMDEQTLERAFDPFFSTKFPGRGLGLAVVLGVVRAHSGGLEVESKPGRGTMVRVYLKPG